MLKKIRLAALAAVLLVAACVRGRRRIRAQAQTQPPAPAAPRRTQAATPPAPPPAPAASTAGEDARGRRQPVRPRSAVWKGGDIVARTTLLRSSCIMSMGSWYIIVTKVYEQYKMGAQAQGGQKTFWKAPSCRQGAEALKKAQPVPLHRRDRARGDAASTTACSATSTSTNGSRCRSSARSTTCKAALQDGLAFLATVGSTAPFVGLFGTVWGIYHALTAIGIAGQASIDKVAGPVGEALIMTAIGLAVAVPAVLGYNWLVRRNKAAMDRCAASAPTCTRVLLGAHDERGRRRRA